jgi:hypothetical protein
MVRKLLGPVVLALAFPVLLAAQSQATTGVIRGTVTDPSGTPVAGATVVLRESQTGFQRQVATNERGVFIAPLMPLGSYDVTARAVGFGEARRTGVRLGVGETVSLRRCSSRRWSSRPRSRSWMRPGWRTPPASRTRR